VVRAIIITDLIVYKNDKIIKMVLINHCLCDYFTLIHIFKLISAHEGVEDLLSLLCERGYHFCLVLNFARCVIILIYVYIYLINESIPYATPKSTNSTRVTIVILDELQNEKLFDFKFPRLMCALVTRDISSILFHPKTLKKDMLNDRSTCLTDLSVFL